MTRQILLEGAEEKRVEFQLKIIIILRAVINFGAQAEPIVGHYSAANQTGIGWCLGLRSTVQGTILGHCFGERNWKRKENDKKTG